MLVVFPSRFVLTGSGDTIRIVNLKGEIGARLYSQRKITGTARRGIRKAAPVMVWLILSSWISELANWERKCKVKITISLTVLGFLHIFK